MLQQLQLCLFVPGFGHTRPALTLYMLHKPCVVNWHTSALVGSSNMLDMPNQAPVLVSCLLDPSAYRRVMHEFRIENDS
jgi:hypothetical protein